MAPIQWSGRNAPKPLTNTIDYSQAVQSPVSRRLTMIWLLGMLVLLPADFVDLPLNMTPVDCWILLALPALWLSFVRGSHTFSLSYAFAMWVIWVASFASTFAAPSPRNGLIDIFKEIYVYIWFITLTAVLVTLSIRDLRRLLFVWWVIVLLHGLVMLAQFLSPEVWRFIASIVNRSSEYDIYRPSGLFINPNGAAVFQLLGFVPLVLASPSRKAGMSLGVLLLVTILTTGSMGATVAFIVGLIVALSAIFLNGRLGLIIKMFMQLAIILSLLGGLLYFIVTHNARYQEHFERILLGRADRSSDSRFALWQEGMEVFLDQGVFIFGVGPENFRELGAKGKTLHSDFMAFLVERGLIGLLGLGLFSAAAVSRAAYMVVIYNKYPDRAQLTVVVFLAAMIAIAVESLTHQVFHLRVMWLVLAFQEALLYKMMTSASGLEPTTGALNEPPPNLPGFVVRPDMTGS